jgi:hypothetical protein
MEYTALLLGQRVLLDNLIDKPLKIERGSEGYLCEAVLFPHTYVDTI